uniref:Adenylate kinase 7a n=1 Tax=Cyprinus carpio TaxID=7962 RepID=A0A8C2KC04_CYPCA
SGLQYGMGENIFHFFFKTAWLGELNSIPVSGPGTNIIPAIHIHDLARFEKLVVQNFIDHKPKTHNFIAVDDSKNTFEDIVKVICHPTHPLYICVIYCIPLLNAMLTLKKLTCFTSVTLNLHWECESGIVDNISQVLEEYKQTRQLLPIKICLLGPPAVGKSSVAVKLCRQYKLHHTDVNKTIKEKVRRLVSEIYSEELLEGNEKTSENEEMLIGAEAQLKTLKNNMLCSTLEIIGINDISSYCFYFIIMKINAPFCEHKILFSETLNSLIPKFIFSLDATDEFLKERVQSLPQNVAEEMHYTQDEFTESLAQFRETLAEDESVLDYFDYLEIQPEHIDCENVDTVEKIIKTVGRPKNYGPSPEELEEERKRKEDERLHITCYIVITCYNKLFAFTLCHILFTPFQAEYLFRNNSDD